MMAFQAIPLSLNATITKTFTDVDTFYSMVKVTRENKHEYTSIDVDYGTNYVYNTVFNI